MHNTVEPCCKTEGNVLFRTYIQSTRSLTMRAHKSIYYLIAACLVLAFSVPGHGAEGTTLSVEITTQPETPVRITNFRFDASQVGTIAFQYDVQNKSGQGLLAVEVHWEAQAGEMSSTFPNRSDNWLTGQLAADQSEHFQVSNVANFPRQPLTRLVGTIAYAELEDGTRFGTDAAQIGMQIDAARRAAAASYSKLLDTFNSGGGEALTQALKLQSAARGQDPAVQEATGRLSGILHDQGVDAAVKELQRVATLSIPEAHP
jgi:hypothetical protein